MWLKAQVAVSTGWHACTDNHVSALPLDVQTVLRNLLSMRDLVLGAREANKQYTEKAAVKIQAVWKVRLACLACLACSTASHDDRTMHTAALAVHLEPGLMICGLQVTKLLSPVPSCTGPPASYAARIAEHFPNGWPHSSATRGSALPCEVPATSQTSCCQIPGFQHTCTTHHAAHTSAR